MSYRSRKYRKSPSPWVSLIAMMLLFSITFSNFGLYVWVDDDSELLIALAENCEHEGEPEEKESKYEGDFEKFFLHLSTAAFSHSFDTDFFELPIEKSKSPSLDTVKPPPKFTC